LRRKSFLFAGIAIAANVVGNVLLGAGMHQVGPTVSLSPLAYVHVLSNPLAVAGVVTLTTWFLANLSLLSWADLSFVLPVTSTGYALTALLGWGALGEVVPVHHWIAVALITVGAGVVSRTRPHTTGADAPRRKPA
jgi:uncharacterized membrane protein